MPHQANLRISQFIQRSMKLTDDQVYNNIQKYGGNNQLIFVSGHSAGGYLASMVGLDKKWLAVHNIDANAIAGLIPFSGHAITHFTVREERGIA